MKKGQRTTASPEQKNHHSILMANNWNHCAPTLHQIVTPEQQARIPTLALLHLHLQGSAANWPATAYEAVAEWCGKHQPEKEHLWRRFAHWRAEAAAQPEGQP
jgi:hypothetical protein